jgi:hypothetical protein
VEAYAGFEPQVGEIRALRTFRVGPGGWLYPLFSDAAWVEGTNTAACRLHVAGERHDAPDPDCTCGFYAYGSLEAAAQYPFARNVLAVVACWGRVVAGTRGLRAEHCRVEALWLSGSVPDQLVAQVREHYPSVVILRDRGRLLSEHPLTHLDCYEEQGTRSPARWLWPAAAAAVVLGAVPLDRLVGSRTAALLWAAVGGCFMLIALTRGGRAGDAAGQQRLVSVAVALWMFAPLGGPLGLVMLRLPLVELAALALLRRQRMVRAAARFPAEIG